MAVALVSAALIGGCANNPKDVAPTFIKDPRDMTPTPEAPPTTTGPAVTWNFDSRIVDARTTSQVTYAAQGFKEGDILALQRQVGRGNWDIVARATRQSGVIPYPTPAMGQHSYRVILIREGRTAANGGGRTLYSYANVPLAEVMGYSRPGVVEANGRTFEYDMSYGGIVAPVLSMIGGACRSVRFEATYDRSTDRYPPTTVITVKSREPEAAFEVADGQFVAGDVTVVGPWQVELPPNLYTYLSGTASCWTLPEQ